MPVGGLLIGETNAQECFLAKRLTHDLHAYRQVVGEACRYGDSWDSGYVHGHGAYVAQIHLHWVF